MTALAIKLDARALGVTDDILRRIEPLDGKDLMVRLGRMIQLQTRRRLHSEKRSPAGAPWQPNKAGTSLMVKTGALANSIDYHAGSDQVIVGSGLVYARIHQTGGTIVPKDAKRLVFKVGNSLVFAMRVNIPARPYLGVSAENAASILETTAEFIKRRLGL